jgi:hypothetical protein
MMLETKTQLISQRPPGRSFPWPCARCGKRQVWPVEIAYQSKMWYEDQPYVVDTPHLNIPRCSECAELYFDNWADEQIDLAFRAQVALLTPEEIRTNRAALGLSRPELAVRLGVEEDLVRRWEENSTLPSRVMDRSLRLCFATLQVPSVLQG